MKLAKYPLFYCILEIPAGCREYHFVNFKWHRDPCRRPQAREKIFRYCTTSSGTFFDIPTNNIAPRCDPETKCEICSRELSRNSYKPLHLSTFLTRHAKHTGGKIRNDRCRPHKKNVTAKRIANEVVGEIRTDSFPAREARRIFDPAGGPLKGHFWNSYWICAWPSQPRLKGIFAILTDFRASEYGI